MFWQKPSILIAASTIKGNGVPFRPIQGYKLVIGAATWWAYRSEQRSKQAKKDNVNEASKLVGIRCSQLKTFQTLEKSISSYTKEVYVSFLCCSRAREDNLKTPSLSNECPTIKDYPRRLAHCDLIILLLTFRTSSLEVNMIAWLWG